MKKSHLKLEVKLKAVNAIVHKNQTIAQVAKTLDVDYTTVHRWIVKSKNSASLARTQNPKSGRQSKLLGKDLKAVLRILKRPATKYNYLTDFWTTRRLGQVIKKELGISVSRMSIFRSLVSLKQSYKTPETRYYEADSKEQEIWLLKMVPKIKATVKRFNAIQYFEDEANVSLTPVVAKTWGPIGEKVIKKITGNRGSISVISAISNDGRLLFNVHDNNKRYCAKDIVRFLSQMLAHHPRRHLVVVMDKAPCHKSKLVESFIKSQKRLHVFYLPARSPEFNPDEKVWDHLKNQTLKSHQAKTTKALKLITVNELKKMAKNKRIVKGIFMRSEVATFFC